MTPSPMTAQPCAPTTLTRHHAVAMSAPLACGAVAAFPGDIVVGDTARVICSLAQRAKLAAVQALERAVCEGFVLDVVQVSASTFKPYAPNDPKNPKSYKTWRAQNSR